MKTSLWTLVAAAVVWAFSLSAQAADDWCFDMLDVEWKVKATAGHSNHLFKKIKLKNNKDGTVNVKIKDDYGDKAKADLGLECTARPPQAKLEGDIDIDDCTHKLTVVYPNHAGSDPWHQVALGLSNKHEGAQCDDHEASHLMELMHPGTSHGSDR